MDGQTNPPQHGSTQQTPSSQASPSGVQDEAISEGLDMFDLQLRKDCANAPGSFVGGLGANFPGLPPSPTVGPSGAMFSSVATAPHILTSVMSDPQTTRCMVRDIAQVILRYMSALGEPQPERLCDDYKRQIIFQFVEELQRSSVQQQNGVSSGGDGRLTIDKEVRLSLKNGREGPPPGVDAPRPHHPYAGWHGSGVTGSPRGQALPMTGTTVQQQQQPQLWRGTPPTITGTSVNARNPGEGSNPSTAPHHASLTTSSLGKRWPVTDLIRPQPHHARGGVRCPGDRRHHTASAKKVLRSASSAFSECSAGETGEVSSSMSRTTAGTIVK
ncbi:hypothetical protein ERJ75_000060800 [Trypanosoma vivax]|uniref:Uncharacterized protein n=1 Tax=Trypanosoma vivax (strain Y486) TaxID=1055687 RepID=G0TVH9_TRYVY|nr:hypothetical protein TRVL_01509 [Trypanosoma vivax]KAH8620463.1 hypothetical protein ERJ75_000060800 [Trypanosoma vivax]CCC47945.1 conserved hypothetical protein [Trypanosoma vivax Y486]